MYSPHSHYIVQTRIANINHLLVEVTLNNNHESYIRRILAQAEQ